MIIASNNYRVHFPLEAVTEWMKYRGVMDGAILEQQEIIIRDIELDLVNGYLIVDGDLETRQDS